MAIAKKAPVKKAATKKDIIKKPAIKKPAAKKTPAKKDITKKPAIKKPATKKTPAKKVTKKKDTAEKKYNEESFFKREHHKKKKSAKNIVEKNGVTESTTSIWEDEEYNQVYEEENSYINDPEKGIALLSQFMSNEKNRDAWENNKNISTLEWLIDERLLGGSKVNIANELDFYKRLTSFTDRLLEQKKFKLLQDKCIIGIGGKVSAGKSRFINSLLGGEVLPEDQAPCTAIPTYIVKGIKNNYQAYTMDNREIILEKEAVQALAHTFHKKYNIGFSNIITNIVINSEVFTYNNIAILDTPGYNKVDSDVLRNISDAEKAFEELKGVDYLLWLVDSVKGCVPQDDLQFIQSLSLRNPPLIVYNKADKKETAILDIVNETIGYLEERSIETLGVIAYSSMERKEYTAKGMLADFFYQRNTEKLNNIRNEINTLIKKLEKEEESQKTEKIQIKNNLSKLIYESVDTTRISSVVNLYSETVKEIGDISYLLYNTDKNTKEINNRLDSLGF